MPWITFTAADIKTRIAARELKVYQSSAEKEYPEEGGDAVAPADAVVDARIDAIAAQVLARFRGVIRSNPKLTYMGAAGTLPDFCIESAAIIGRVGLIGLSPVPEGMTDPRAKEYADALKFLAGLALMGPAAFLEEDTPAEEATTCPSYGGKDLLDF